MTASQARPGGQHLADERGAHETELRLVLAPVERAVAPLHEFVWAGLCRDGLVSFSRFYDGLPPK